MKTLRIADRDEYKQQMAMRAPLDAAAAVLLTR
jgi:hypothetical protein